MSREFLLPELGNTKYNYGNHELLVNMSCVFDDYEPDGFEITFAVPIDWLVNWLEWADNGNEWNREKVLAWLNNEYTSEDSEKILVDAITKNKIAFWKLTA